MPWSMENIWWCRLYGLCQKRHKRGYHCIKTHSQSKDFVLFFFFHCSFQRGLFDWLSAIVHLSRYWSEGPKGMWHHYEAWPYHLLPCSSQTGLGQNLMATPPNTIHPKGCKLACRREIGSRVICFPDLVAHLTPKASLRRPITTSGRCWDNILLRWRLRVGSLSIRMKMILLHCQSQIFYQNNFWASKINKNKPKTSQSQARPNISFTVGVNANKVPSKGRMAFTEKCNAATAFTGYATATFKMHSILNRGNIKHSVRESQHPFIKDKYLVLNLC